MELTGKAFLSTPMPKHCCTYGWPVILPRKEKLNMKTIKIELLAEAIFAYNSILPEMPKSFQHKYPNCKEYLHHQPTRLGFFFEKNHVVISDMVLSKIELLRSPHAKTLL